MGQPIPASAIPEVLENRRILRRIEQTLEEIKRTLADIETTVDDLEMKAQ